jgi:hypothetical protein
MSGETKEVKADAKSYGSGDKKGEDPYSDLTVQSIDKQNVPVDSLWKEGAPYTVIVFLRHFL